MGQHEICSAWRNKLLRLICTRGDSFHTDPVLLTMLIDQLYACFQQESSPPLTAYPAAYRQLVRKQTTLGWRQLFNGRWSTEWARLHNRYLKRHFNPIPDQLIGSKWMAHHIDLMWTQMRKLWDLRNGKVHGVDTSTHMEA